MTHDIDWQAGIPQMVFILDNGERDKLIAERDRLLREREAQGFPNKVKVVVP